MLSFANINLFQSSLLSNKHKLGLISFTSLKIRIAIAKLDQIGLQLAFQDMLEHSDVRQWYAFVYHIKILVPHPPCSAPFLCLTLLTFILQFRLRFPIETFPNLFPNRPSTLDVFSHSPWEVPPSQNCFYCCNCSRDSAKLCKCRDHA